MAWKDTCIWSSDFHESSRDRDTKNNGGKRNNRIRGSVKTFQDIAPIYVKLAVVIFIIIILCSVYKMWIFIVLPTS